VVHTDPATVLVVDDEETICEIVKRSLQDLGLVCITAPSGEEALEWLRTNQPWPDLLIVDIRLPGMSGPEFVRETMKTRKANPVLYISGYAQEAAEIQHKVSDTVAFLPKPFGYEQLIGAVRRLLSIGSPAQDS
jgi:DNA-binding NtrC family response regulator